MELLDKGKADHLATENINEFRFIIKLSLDGIITHITESSKELLGYEPEKIIGTHISKIMHHGDYQSFMSECYRENEEIGTKSYRMLKRDGSDVEVEITYTSMNNRHFPEGSILFIKNTITKREEAALLLDSEKLKVVGQLAAGVAHEIKNPLTSIKGFIQLMKVEEVPNKKYLEIMEDEIQRLESISSELLVLAKPHKNEVEIYDLIKLVKEVTLLLEAEALQRSIQFCIHVDEAAMMILCDRHKVKQVLINIIKNGIEAMEQPGVITIRMSRNGKIAQVSISDQGCGIPKEYLHRLGNPFFSAKSTGNGLGLMISQQIISEHQGKINVESIEGTGTTFTINIPLIMN